MCTYLLMITKRKNGRTRTNRNIYLYGYREYKEEGTRIEVRGKIFFFFTRKSQLINAEGVIELEIIIL